MTNTISEAPDRSKAGKRFYRLICDYTRHPDQITRTEDGKLSRGDVVIAAIIKMLEEASKTPRDLCLLGEKNHSGTGILQDILYLCFEAKLENGKAIFPNPKDGEEVAMFLMKLITQENWWKLLGTDTKQEILLASSPDSNLLQQAVNTNNLTILNFTNELLEKTLAPEKYQDAVTHITQSGHFSLLNCAVDKSIGVFSAALDLCKQLPKDKYHGLLCNITADGSSILDSVLRFKSAEMFHSVMDDCKGLPEDKYRTVLNTINKKGFSLPITAAKSGDSSVFMRVMNDPALEKQTLTARPNNYGFIFTVVRHGDQQRFQKAVERVIELCGREECLNQLTHINRDGHTPATSASQSRNSGLSNLINSVIRSMEK